MKILRLLPRFQQAYGALQKLEQRETWSASQIATYQLGRLNQLWQHAIQTVPYYVSLHQTHSLPDQFASLAEFTDTVPLLTKSAVRQVPNQFLSRAAKRGSWQRTSGSTGIPTRIYHDAKSHREMQHAKYRLYQSWDIDILDRSVYLWSRADAVMHGWERLFRKTRLNVLDALRSRRRLSAFDLSPERLRGHLGELERFRPRAIYGFSNAIYQLALEALDQGFSCESLRAVILTSEPATERMRRVVTEAFKAPVVVEYGATECELIAGLQPDGTLRVRDDLVFLETLSRPSGEQEIVITVLTNPSFPLFRYQIEDITTCPVERPERGFAVLGGGIGGRRDDLLQTRSGTYLHPTGIDALFESVVDSTAIRRYRVHQRASGQLDVQLEIEPQRASSLNVEKLRDALRTLVEGFPVEVSLFGSLPASTSVKHRAITSDRTAAGHSASS